MNPGRYFHERRVVRPLLRWIIPAAVILLAVAGPRNSAGSGPTTSTGVQVTERVPFVRESIDEIRALAPMRERTVPEDRVLPSHRISRGSGTTGQTGVPLAAALAAPATPVSAASPSSMAPVLAGSFQGLINPPHGQRDVIPPNAIGTAGPNHLVSLLNTEFGVFDKVTGALLDNVSLESFWGSIVTQPDFAYDTRVLYDQHSGRFVALSIAGTAAPNSSLLVAVTRTPDPRGIWDKWAIDADVDGGTVQTANSADFPGVGIDAYNVYVTANMFNATGGYQYSKVWVIPMAQLLAGSNPITWTEFPNPPGSLSTMQPAHVLGSAAAEYLLFEDWYIPGLPPPNRFRLATIDNVSGTPVWHAPVFVDVAPYTQDFGLPAAPQAGDSRGIDTTDTRLWNVVYRNGFLWTTHHVAANSKVEAAWYRIDAVTRSVTQGRISDPARWYYYPSIAVNQDDVAAIGFSGSSAAEYAGGYYTILRPPYAAAEPVALLKSGEDTYFKDFGYGVNRWGDLSATTVDPSDNMTFWTLQEYAWTHDPVSGVSRWGTWWGKFRPSDVPAPSGLTATVVSGTQVNLGWTDQSGNESGFGIERRRLPGGDYLEIGTVGPNTSSFTDNASTGLVQGFSYSYRIRAFDATGGSYSGESYVPAPTPTPSGGGGGGGCLTLSRSGGEPSFTASLVPIGILLLPAAALGLRRFSRRFAQKRTFRHPAC
jgi:hypothetical protein